MYRFTDDEEMPSYASLQRPPQAPAARKPTASKKPAPRKPASTGGQSHASRSQNAKQQPRDWRGRFASVGRKIKQVKKRVRKIRQALSIPYRMQRAQRTRRASERQELRRQGFNVPQRRSRKRMPRYRVR